MAPPGPPLPSHTTLQYYGGMEHAALRRKALGSQLQGDRRSPEAQIDRSWPESSRPSISPPAHFSAAMHFPMAMVTALEPAVFLQEPITQADAYNQPISFQQQLPQRSAPTLPRHSAMSPFQLRVRAQGSPPSGPQHFATAGSGEQNYQNPTWVSGVLALSFHVCKCPATLCEGLGLGMKLEWEREGECEWEWLASGACIHKPYGTDIMLDYVNLELHLGTIPLTQNPRPRGRYVSLLMRQ